MTTRWRSHIPRPCLSFTHLASSGFSLDRTPLQLMIMMTAAALRRARAPADTIRHAAAAICATARAVRVRPKLPTAYLATRRAVYYCPAPTGAVPGKMCVRSARVQMHKRERNAIPRILQYMNSCGLSAPRWHRAAGSPASCRHARLCHFTHERAGVEHTPKHSHNFRAARGVPASAVSTATDPSATAAVPSATATVPSATAAVPAGSTVPATTSVPTSAASAARVYDTHTRTHTQPGLVGIVTLLCLLPLLRLLRLHTTPTMPIMPINAIMMVLGTAPTLRTLPKKIRDCSPYFFGALCIFA